MSESPQSIPAWLRCKSAASPQAREVKRLLRRTSLNSVCEEARCPNLLECFSRRTATFLILGDVCTRACRFCSVKKGRPVLPPSSFVDEASRVAEAAAELSLSFVVVTSVTRDDLDDGGAQGFILAIEHIRRRCPDARIEVLIPDFGGNLRAVKAVVEAGPDVLAHNLETVPRLYPLVRAGASYERSLEVLAEAKGFDKRLITKTGVMLGLGETREEMSSLMQDARASLVDIFTAGQYMRPTKESVPVSCYLPEEAFESYRLEALRQGFLRALVAPLVRSSYMAADVFGERDGREQ